jgi:hypothetical protein
MQFTLKRLLISITIIVIGIAGITLPWRVTIEEYRALDELSRAFVRTHYHGSPIIIGAGIGNIFARWKTGAVAGFAFYLIIGAIV